MKGQLYKLGYGISSAKEEKAGAHNQASHNHGYRLVVRLVEAGGAGR